MKRFDAAVEGRLNTKAVEKVLLQAAVLLSEFGRGWETSARLIGGTAGMCDFHPQ